MRPSGPNSQRKQLSLALDRSLAIPVSVQLRGQIEYGIALGELSAGEQLPSVRELASMLELAPVTISNVYKELQEQDLIETLPGKGTFVKQRTMPVPDERNTLALHHMADDLLAHAASLGFSPAEVAHVLHAKISRFKLEVKPLRLAFLGIFDDATRAYTASIRWYLKLGDTITPVTFGQLKESNDLRHEVSKCDAILTLGHREVEAQALLGKDIHIVPIRFIPSMSTRTSLAALSPQTRIAGVATFPEFVLTMRGAIRRYTSHVADAKVLALEDPELQLLLSWGTVVVYATGAERVLEALPPRVEAFEFRHMPEPNHIEATLLPLLEQLRYHANITRGA